MPREELDQQLNMLQQDVATLAGVVEKAVQRAVDALKRRDLEASQQVVAEDDYIDDWSHDEPVNLWGAAFV